jgi:hypothetical protein
LAEDIDVITPERLIPVMSSEAPGRVGGRKGRAGRSKGEPEWMSRLQAVFNRMTGSIHNDIAGKSAPHAFKKKLREKGVTEEEASFYVGGVKKGATLVIVGASENEQEEVGEILKGAAVVLTRKDGES